MKNYLYLFLCILPLLVCGQTPEKAQGLQLDVGMYHFSLLDHQASPIIYALNTPMLGLGYQHENAKRVLETGLYFTLGQFQAKDKDVPTFLDNEITTYAFGLDFNYWKILTKNEQWTHYIGGSLAYDFTIDFEAIADFPWGMGRGRLGVGYWGIYTLTNAHQLSVKAKVPLVGFITRLPYSNIPRVLGKIAGVSSFFEAGTSIATWNTYQYVDLELAYTLPLNEKWTLEPTYHLSYFAHNQPDQMRAYNQMFTFALRYGF